MRLEIDIYNPIRRRLVTPLPLTPSSFRHPLTPIILASRTKTPDNQKMTKQAQNALERPLMLYDGDCGFCARWIARWERWTKGRVEYAPYQIRGPEFKYISDEALEIAVHLIDTNGVVHRGAKAVFMALASGGGLLRLPLLVYEYIPFTKPISELCYRIIAHNRKIISKIL